MSDPKKMKIVIRTTATQQLDFPSQAAAEEWIMNAFAETGQNPVEEVWMEDELGNEITLAVNWQVSLEEV